MWLAVDDWPYHEVIFISASPLRGFFFECPKKPGLPFPRQDILETIGELVGFWLPNLHLRITSRPEVDIRAALEPLTSHPVSLHDEGGRRPDIIDYIVFVVHTDPRMWCCTV